MIEYTDWNIFREESINYQKHREKSVLQKWFAKIETFKETIGYSISLSDREAIIYTTSPGILIGRAGTTVEELKKLLVEEFGGEWTVNFVEVRGGFISKEGI